MISFKIFIFDFDDSFTFNIANRLLKMGLQSEVVVQKNHKRILDKILKIKDEKYCLILGPGPGHPNEYSLINSFLDRLLKKENILMFGICLGHQILMKKLGYKIAKKVPNHGISQNIFYKNKIVSVQQYNSLVVKYRKNSQNDGKILLYDGDIWGFESERLVSWQFHPESVGTTCPLLFFSSIPIFLYNSKDGNKKKNQN